MGSRPASVDHERRNEYGTVLRAYQEQDLSILVVQSQLVEDSVEPAHNRRQPVSSGSGTLPIIAAGDKSETAPVHQEHLLSIILMMDLLRCHRLATLFER